MRRHLLWMTIILSWTVSVGAESTARVTLDDCITAALETNPGLQAASHRVRAARHAHTQAKSGWYPRVFAHGNYARTDNPTQAFMMELNQRTLEMSDPGFNPNDPDDTENLRLGLGVQYRLFDGGRRSADSRMSGLQADALRYAEDAARNELIFEVTRGYYSVLQARAFLEVQDEAVAGLEESLRVAGERLRAGSVIQTDVLNLEVQLAQAREDRIRARNGLALSVAALNTAIGAEWVTDPDTLMVPHNDLPEPLAEEPDAVANRPELLAAHRQMAMTEQGVRRARGAYAPAINAFGTMDWDSDVSSNYERSYVVGVMAEWDLFDGFRRPKAVSEARARQDEARAMLEQLRNQLRLDLKQAHLQEADARERLEVARRIVDSAGESLRITRERYEQGAADITELLNAQVAATATRTRHAAAFYDVLIARANVNRALGSGGE